MDQADISISTFCQVCTLKSVIVISLSTMVKHILSIGVFAYGYIFDAMACYKFLYFFLNEFCFISVYHFNWSWIRAYLLFVKKLTNGEYIFILKKSKLQPCSDSIHHC